MRNAFQHLLPGVPLIESPFFDRVFAEGHYSAEQQRIARDLHTRGYSIIDFPDAEIGARAERIIDGMKDRMDWVAWRDGRIDSLRLQDEWQSNPDVRAIAANARIVELLSMLYGRRAFPFQTLNFAVGTQQHIHTDSVHFSSHPERFMCGVWVALEDVDLDSGPLIYCPGSHAWPLYTNEHIGANSSELKQVYGHYDRYEALWDSLIEVHGAKIERFCPRKGQALIWTANLLHGGDRMHDLNRTRWSQVTHYYFEGCCYYGPLLSDPFYGRIAFRDAADISTAQPLAHTVSGHPVPENFIRIVRPLPPDFDPEAYLRVNPDVAAAGCDPREHYLSFGFRESRGWR